MHSASAGSGVAKDQNIAQGRGSPYSSIQSAAGWRKGARQSPFPVALEHRGCSTASRIPSAVRRRESVHRTLDRDGLASGRIKSLRMGHPLRKNPPHNVYTVLLI